ncbi:hypothetical protein DSECCO2_620840 [anaerobic digester metagenome]
MFIDEINHDIEKIFDSSFQAKYCQMILDYIVTNSCAVGMEFTYLSFSRILELHVISSELIEAVNFLSGSKWKVLDVHFSFIDEDDKDYEISKGEVREALITGVFIHPLTGSIVKDSLKNIIAYFTPSTEFISKVCR